ncbi:MAG: helix-turn-helix transcriptional regulator [Clostridiaceae bacterium]
MGNKIKDMREKKQMSQYKLAELAGLSQSQISKIEQNKRKLKADELKRISEVLEIQIEELI